VALPETDAEFDQRVAAAVSTAIQNVMPPANTQCRADFPHVGPDWLVYKGDGLYSCRCGQVYRKAGRGMLEEVT